MNLHVLCVSVCNLTLNSHTLLCCDCVLLYCSVLCTYVCVHNVLLYISGSESELETYFVAGTGRNV